MTIAPSQSPRPHPAPAARRSSPVAHGDRQASRSLTSVAALAALLFVFALVPSARAADVVYGVVPQDGALPTQDDLALMPDANITSIRTILSWSNVEPTPGQYNWAGIDEIVRQTSSHGIAMFPFLFGTPEWAAADGQPQVRGRRLRGVRPEVRRNARSLQQVRRRGRQPLRTRRRVLDRSRKPAARAPSGPGSMRADPAPRRARPTSRHRRRPIRRRAIPRRRRR